MTARCLLLVLLPSLPVAAQKATDYRHYAKETFPAPVAAQKASDYRHYAKTVLAAESLFAKNDVAGAVNRYQQLFETYDFVFARDAYNACQLAAVAGNRKQFDAFFYQCTRAGLSKGFLLRNNLLNPPFAKDTSALNRRYAEGRNLFLRRIDPKLRAEFINRYSQEQRSKGEHSFAQVCTNNFNRIATLAKQGTFPSERRIGPAESLDRDYIVPTLCHYPYSYTALLPEALRAVQQGDLQPEAVIYWYDFNQTRTSDLYTARLPKDTIRYKAIYNFAFGYRSADSAAVDRLRAAACMHDQATMRAIRTAATRYGVDYRDGI